MEDDRQLYMTWNCILPVVWAGMKLESYIQTFAKKIFEHCFGVAVATIQFVDVSI